MHTPQDHNPNIRRGQFLWREQSEREEYLAKIHRRIAGGFYSSDRIIEKVVDELAPVFCDDHEDGYSSHW
ncbi:MAG: hypothetical protein GF344_10675 [Chitinivibrionales bacterium]|nr:hypothetical protein [Chitinivibrionales bacterium]